MIAIVAPSGVQILMSLKRESAPWIKLTQSASSRSRALNRVSIIMSISLRLVSWDSLTSYAMKALTEQFFLSSGPSFQAQAEDIRL